VIVALSPGDDSEKAMRRRLGTWVAPVASGLTTALIFVLFGAPDLAMTQFMVESLTVILFVGGMLFDGGFTDDLRLAEMGLVVHPMTRRALHELGIDADLEPGPVSPRDERLRAVRSARNAHAVSSQGSA